MTQKQKRQNRQEKQEIKNTHKVPTTTENPKHLNKSPNPVGSNPDPQGN
jgi:hypothetical protein